MDSRYILFVAMTRPAMNRFGIPHFWFAMIVAASSLSGMWLGRTMGPWGLLWFGVFVPLYLGGRILTEWDHNFSRILQIWFMTKAKGLGKPGGYVLSPLPSRLPRNARDIAGAV